jgi:hypothetical protein
LSHRDLPCRRTRTAAASRACPDSVRLSTENRTCQCRRMLRD